MIRRPRSRDAMLQDDKESCYLFRLLQTSNLSKGETSRDRGLGCVAFGVTHFGIFSIGNLAKVTVTPSCIK